MLHLFRFAVPVACVASALLSGNAAAQRLGGTTTLTSEVDIISGLVVTNRTTSTVQNYATLLEARMPGGPVLFSQLVSYSFLDPRFATVLLQANSALTAAGAVGVVGPTLVSSVNQVSDVSTSTVRTGFTTREAGLDRLLVGTLERVGETEFVGGYFGLCTNFTLFGGQGTAQTFVLPTGCTGAQLRNVIVRPGDTVLETRAAFFLDYLDTETTTTTMLLRQEYALVGVPASTTVPEPRTVWLVVVGVGALAMQRRVRGLRR